MRAEAWPLLAHVRSCGGGLACWPIRQEWTPEAEKPATGTYRWRARRKKLLLALQLVNTRAVAAFRGIDRAAHFFFASLHNLGESGAVLQQGDCRGCSAALARPGGFAAFFALGTYLTPGAFS